MNASPTRPDPPLARRTDLALVSAHVEMVAFQLNAWLTQLLHDGYTFLIVAVEDACRYVQFIADDGDDFLRAEAVGNTFLDDPHRLTAAELADLDRLGWEPPETNDPFVGNHWRMWSPPNVADAAQLGALTLCRVGGLTDATLPGVTVTAGNSGCRPPGWSGFRP